MSKRVKKPKTKQSSLAERLLALGKRNAVRMTPEQRNVDYDKLLYDERGLPK
jgi:hypothetical protein